MAIADALQPQFDREIGITRTLLEPVLRTFVLGRIIYHRGQLSMYLGLNGVVIPPIHGPSADER